MVLEEMEKRGEMYRGDNKCKEYVTAANREEKAKYKQDGEGEYENDIWHRRRSTKRTNRKKNPSSNPL